VKKSERVRITSGMIVRILERQKYRYAMCGKPLKPKNYHIDHKKPLALGGSNTLRNLQALCPNCHDIKTKKDRERIAKARRKKEKRKGDS